MFPTLKALSVLSLSFLSAATLRAVDYNTFNYPDADGGSTYLTGIRGYTDPNTVLISGVYTPAGSSSTQGLLYTGGLDSASSGVWTAVTATVSGTVASSTALYGPNTISPGNVRVVGSYKVTGSQIDHGLIYTGATNGTGTYQNFDVPFAGTVNTIAHSTHGQLAVGNYDNGLTGHAFVYNFNGSDVVNSANFMDLSKPGAVSMTAYGVWNNGGTSYTIAGGFSDVNNGGADEGYLVDYDSATGVATHWTAFNFSNAPTSDLVSHFDGITGDGNGGYYLTGDWIGAGETDGLGFFAHVARNGDGTFGPAEWTQIAYPGGAVTSGNSVYEDTVIGVYTLSSDPGTTIGFTAVVPEPHATGLLAFGLAGFGLLMLARRAKLQPVPVKVRARRR